ncbi:tRNA pseudouridine synthase 3 [Lobulomyces angularis]|nr:tRNA pseudouridine synthase 3 [Lobulomyces angularis]
MNKNYLNNLTRIELIQKISQLEALINNSRNSNDNLNENAGYSTTTEVSISKKLKKIKKEPKPFDFTKYKARRIALKFAYIGTNYHGLTSSIHDTVETVESHLLDALIKSKLIPARESFVTNWSRCGRTDKGVHSFDQVCSFYIRTNLPLDDSRLVDWPTKQEDEKKLVFREDALNPRKPQIESIDSTFIELPYISMINRLLPNDIRVIAWSPVSANFDARFSCVHRRYKYFFPKRDLNIEIMNKACKLFIGEHDWRNFCKFDVRLESVSFKREITECKVHPVGFEDIENLEEIDFKAFSKPTDFFVFVVKGNSFLWHQVRCMMAILFLIGEEKEDPSVISNLLDISQHPENSGKPLYPMASEASLVLVECGFDKEHFLWKTEDDIIHEPQKKSYQLNSDTHINCQEKILETFWNLLSESSIKTSILNSFVSNFNRNLNLSAILKKSELRGVHFNKGNYVPILSRQRCDSLDVRRKKGEDHKEKLKFQAETKAKKKGNPNLKRCINDTDNTIA